MATGHKVVCGHCNQVNRMRKDRPGERGPTTAGGRSFRDRPSARLGIRSIPTLLLIRKGKVVARNSGVMDTRLIVEWTRAHLASRQAI